LVARVGELRTYVLGLGVVAASTGACAVAGQYWQLLVFRSLGGIGSTMFTVASVSMLVRFAPPAMRGRASGLWATGFLLGNVTGPLVGGGLVTFGLRAPFVVYAAMLLVAMTLTGLLLRGRLGAPVGSAETLPELGFPTALAHPAYRAALGAAFANGWAVFGVRVALVPLFVVEVLGRAESWAGLALAVFAAGNAVTLVSAGRLADRRGRRPLILAGLAVSTVATALLGVVPTLALFLAVSLVAGMGSGLVNPPVNAAVADVVGTRVRGGTVLAAYQMASDIGTILGPLVAGAMAQLAGFGAAFGLTGLVTALALVLWLRAPETLPSRS
jgi:MFS family permease